MKILVALLAASFSAVVLSKRVTRLDSTAVLGQLQRYYQKFGADTKIFKDLLASLGNGYESVTAEYEARMLELGAQIDAAVAANKDLLADKLAKQNEDLKNLAEEYVVPRISLQEMFRLISVHGNVVDAMFNKLKGGLEIAIKMESEVVKNQFQPVAKPLPVIEPASVAEPTQVAEPSKPVAKPSKPVV